MRSEPSDSVQIHKVTSIAHLPLSSNGKGEFYLNKHFVRDKISVKECIAFEFYIMREEESRRYGIKFPVLEE